MKALNEYRLSHAEATAEAERALGPENMDLFRAFVRLLVPDSEARAAGGGSARDAGGSPPAVVFDAPRW